MWSVWGEEGEEGEGVVDRHNRKACCVENNMHFENEATSFECFACELRIIMRETHTIYRRHVTLMVFVHAYQSYFIGNGFTFGVAN